jgi:purine-nucleoside phosphorylase
MSSPTSALGLDETVFPLRERLRRASVPDPGVLFLMGTGVGFLPGRLAGAHEVELGELCGECEPWNGQVLRAGRFGTLHAWFLDDVSGEPLVDEPTSPWMRALPVWLAAAAGAQILVHTSGGSALPVPEERRGAGGVPSPAIVALRDHVNFSGSTPLLGLGESKLGPLFPDLSRLHHGGLRAAALSRAAALGIPIAEAVAACTLGPALETPAERTMLARLGAEVSVPNLATPLLAAGHAGLAVLALVAVTDAGDGAADLKSVVAAASALAPALEDLVLALQPDLEAAVTALCAEAEA